MQKLIIGAMHCILTATVSSLKKPDREPEP